jgi:hypothetical protein
MERMISDIGDKETQAYRQEWQESFRPRRLDIQ